MNSMEIGLRILKHLAKEPTATRIELADAVWGEGRAWSGHDHPYLRDTLRELLEERVLVYTVAHNGAYLYTRTDRHPLALKIGQRGRTVRCPTCKRRRALIRRWERWELSCECGHVIADVPL